MKQKALINISIQKKHFYILAALILLFTAAGFTYALNTDPAVFGHADNGPIHIVGDKVGIGTTDPYSKMTVSGVINTLASPDNPDGGALISYTSSSSGYERLDIVGEDVRINTAQFEGASISNTRITIKHTSGNVGIGTTTPQAKLEVVGNIAQIRQANTIEAKNELSTMPIYTTMMPRNWDSQLYFYWKGGDGKMYEAMIVGTEIP